MGSNIDALIAAGIRPPQVEDPQAVAVRALQMRNMAAQQQLQPLQLQQAQMGLEQSQEEMQARRSMNQLLMQKGPQATDDELLGAGGTYATPVIEARNKMRQTVAELQKTQYANQVAEADLAGAAGAKLKALGNTQDALNAITAELPATMRGHVPQLLQMVGGDIGKFADMLVQGSAKQRELLNQAATAAGAQQRGAAAIGELGLRTEENKRKQFEQDKAETAVRLSRAPDQATYDQLLGEVPKKMADLFPAKFDRDEVLDVGRTAQQIVAGEAQADKAMTRDKALTVVSDPAASAEDKQRAQGWLQAETKQRAADRPPTVNVTIPGLGPGQAAAAAQLTGDDYLKSLPPGTAAQVRGIAEGRTTIPSGATRSPAGQALRAAVFQYDPEFSEQRAQIRKAFTTGADGRNIGNLNTAPVHLDQLDQLATALGNNDLQGINRLTNTVSTWFGGAAPTSFNAVKNAAVGEIAAALKGNATDQEIKHIQDTVSSAQSPAQLKGFVDQTLHVLAGKLQTYRERYQQQLPNDKTWSPVLPSAQAVFDRHGVSVGGQPAAAQVRVQKSSKTGEYRYSTDGGKTWQAGRPPQ